MLKPISCLQLRSLGSTRIPRFEVAQALPRLRFQGFAARSPRIKAIPGKNCGVLEPQWRWRMVGFQSRSSGSIKNHPPPRSVVPALAGPSATPTSTPNTPRPHPLVLQFPKRSAQRASVVTLTIKAQTPALPQSIIVDVVQYPSRSARGAFDSDRSGTLSNAEGPSC
jgi:hypothetical protein